MESGMVVPWREVGGSELEYHGTVVSCREGKLKIENSETKSHGLKGGQY